MKDLVSISKHLLLLLFMLTHMSNRSLLAAPHRGDLKEFDEEVMDSFPVPSGNPNQLFYLQRPPNANTVIYELNLDEAGQLDILEPIHVFWIRYPEGGVKKELSYIQRHFAYGLKAELMEDGRYKLIFAAYKKKNLYLMYAQRDKRYHVYTTLLNKQAILYRVYTHSAWRNILVAKCAVYRNER